MNNTCRAILGAMMTAAIFGYSANAPKDPQELDWPS